MSMNRGGKFLTLSNTGSHRQASVAREIALPLSGRRLLRVPVERVFSGMEGCQ